MNPPAGVERDAALARLTTVRTGGAGEYFARAGSESQLLELLAWAGAEDLAVSVVGSGSNLLIADAGVAGLIVKLDRDLRRRQHQADPQNDLTVGEIRAAVAEPKLTRRAALQP